MQICKSEGVNVTVPQLKHVIDVCLGDIRRVVMFLQFWYQGHQFTGLMLYHETLSIFFIVPQTPFMLEPPALGQPPFLCCIGSLFTSRPFSM
jgi:hypothetical protein